MNVNRQMILIAMFAVLLGAPALTAADDQDNPKLAEYRRLSQRVQQDPAGVSDAQVRELLKLGAELRRPYATNLAVKSYLSRHLQPPTDVLLDAAEAARLAGDFRAAVTRYKAYLKIVQPNAVSSEAAGRLYELLVDNISGEADAYDVMRRDGARFRQSTTARKYDPWFLSQAVRRNDYEAVAERLAVIMAEKLPVEQERLHFWSTLDWLTQELSRATAGQNDHFAALGAAKRIVPLIREDKARTARLALAVAQLDYFATAAGKEDEQLEQAYQPVIAQARAYANQAATADRLIDVCQALAGGYGNFHGHWWNRHVGQKQALVIEAFAKLPEAEQVRFIDWTYAYYVLGDKSAELGAKFPAAFAKAKGVERLPFAWRSTDLAVFKQQAAYLKDVQSRDAAVINSIAVGGDMWRAIDHLVKQHSWHMDAAEVNTWVTGSLWPAYNGLERAENQQLPGDYWQKMYVRFGREVIANSPLAWLDQAAARSYIHNAWNHSGKDADDKAAFVEHLKALAWVPYNDKQRGEVFGAAYDEFRRWTATVRKRAEEGNDEQKAAAAPLVALITPLENAFKAAMGDQAGQADAPNPLCAQFAAAIRAIEAKDADAYTAAARQLYEQVKQYETRKTPYGEMVLTFIATNRLEAFDTLDFQLEMLADQLSRQSHGDGTEAIGIIERAMFAGRSGWGWNQIPQADRDKALKLNAVYEKAMLDRLAKNQYNPHLFYRFRYTRTGSGWNAYDTGVAVLDQMIQKRVLLETDSQPVWAVGATAYQYLVQNEWPSLQGKYPPDRYFDDMYIEEAKRKNLWDWNYFSYGRDSDRKVVDAMAQAIAALPRLPSDYGDNPPAMKVANSSFWNWQERAFSASPEPRQAMIAALEASYGKTRFDEFAMGRMTVQSASMSTDSGRAAFFASLDQYLDRAAASPAKVHPPYLGNLQNVHADSLTDGELTTLLKLFNGGAPHGWHRGWHADTAARLVYEGLVRHDRAHELFELIADFWRVARTTDDAPLSRAMSQWSRDLLASEHATQALVMSTIGLDTVGSALPEDARAALLTVRSRSLLEMGDVVAVDRSDPRYPMFAAQAAYLTGKHQTAWEEYRARRDLLESTFKDLDPTFVTWLIRGHTDAKEFDEAERVARMMIQWIDTSSGAFDPEVRAALLVAYADIALARQEYPRARAQYERIAATREFDDTVSQRTAQLKIAETDRVTKQFDAAIQRLEQLIRTNDSYLRAEGSYQLALVKFDQEEYPEAMELLQQVFIFSPAHPNGRILQGRLHLEMKKLAEATQVNVGLSADKRFIVPGRPLKIDLEDRNLAIVGSATDIAIRVWTEGGDEERFSLFPFGDSKTKFEGQIETALGKANKNDHVLQLLGDDLVYYDFADAIGDRDAATRPEPLRVVTTGELYASSGRILTKQELDEQRLESMIRSRLQLDASYDKQLALSVVRPGDRVKPGNPINVRVVDPDRSASNNKDAIQVRVSTTSGDAIGAFTLTETEAHSGVFEGAVTTASAQATAFATDSTEGREPNFVISAGDYPAWVALPDGKRPKLFSVDLNDNVPLGVMTVASNVPGRKLKAFEVQTSINGRDFRTVGAWPEAREPWDGSLRREAVRYIGQNYTPKTPEDFRRYLEHEYVAQGAKKVDDKAKSLSGQWNHTIEGVSDRIGLGWQEWVVVHYYGAFYVSRPQVRTFTVDTHNREDNIQYLLAIDGKAGEQPTAVTRSMSRGVHRFDLYIRFHRHANPHFDVQMDIDEAPFVGPMDMVMFDVETHPEIKDAVYIEPANIEAAEENASFNIAFGEGTRARVVRLQITDYETDAPAIERITLTDADDGRVLPTDQDFLELTKNNILEIVPGDRIAVSYEDEKTFNESESILETFLTASYSNAELSAAFVEFVPDGRGVMEPRYIPLRRFNPGDPVKVFIKDPDKDVSDKRDVVSFTARAGVGEVMQVKALETEEHSGVFVGDLLPVSRATGKDGEIVVSADQDITVTYLDEENTEPGIPWERQYAIEQTWYEIPQVRPFVAQTGAMSAEQQEELAASESEKKYIEHVPARYSLALVRPDAEPLPLEPASVLVEGPLIVELTHPTIAKSPASTATIYAQTRVAREQAGVDEGMPFDVNVPGTIRLTSQPSGASSSASLQGYGSVLVRGNPYAAEPLDEGRFTFNIPMRLGNVPDRSLIDEDERLPADERTPLFVRGDDEVFIGYEYEDDTGAKQWKTQRISLMSNVFFDVMDRRYQEPLAGAHVGEKLYFRVIHKSLDTSDEKDTVTIRVETSSGVTTDVTLTETLGHSGVFKGLVDLVYDELVDEPIAAPADEQPVFENIELAVKYGDVVTATYAPADSTETYQFAVSVFKGADGLMTPFTKRFDDPAIAVQTQFTIAEAYFEMAKRHRTLAQQSDARGDEQGGQTLRSLARREIGQGKKLLEEAIRDYPDTEARAQADYLLANLSFEFAQEAVNEQIRREQYMEAVTRFSDIVSSHPDSPYAPKSQFKKALVLEKMGEIDKACEEYVKLSYRYPDNELVAETIARLGLYFQTKGREFTDRAADAEDEVEREKIRIQSRDMYKTAAEVFGRLAERFPNHHLAGKTTVLSGNCYMQAELYEDAVKVYETVYEDKQADNELAAEAMYWCGDSHLRLTDATNAYRMFKRLTWDYPESKWARFARGRLTEDALVRVAEDDARTY